MRLHLDDKKINDLQRKNIERLIQRTKCANYTDIVLRINGKTEPYEADWLKHLVIVKDEVDA